MTDLFQGGWAPLGRHLARGRTSGHKSGLRRNWDKSGSVVRLSLAFQNCFDFFPTLVCDWLLPCRRLWSIQPIKRTHAFLALSCDLLQETVQCSMRESFVIKQNRAFVCTIFGDFFLRIWPCLLVCLEGVRSKTKQINECAYPLALLATLLCYTI